MKVKDILAAINEWAPFSLQESYDNSGLIVGNPDKEIDKVLVTFDVTEEVLEEAIAMKAQIIVSHHPIVFKGLKRLTGSTYVERVVIKAIQNDIALLAVHTNLDNVLHGTNSILAEKLGLKNIRSLNPMQDHLYKLVTYVPTQHAEKVRNALFEAGAGQIGNYDHCSYNLEGKGSFRAGENSNPFVGEKNKTHYEEEVRIETVFPKHIKGKLIAQLLSAHPYEEVAYDIFPIANPHNTLGSGIIGTLENEVDAMVFLKELKEKLNADQIRHTHSTDKKIKTVALCGGSGAFLISQAMANKADIYISGDIKYHEFFDSEDKMIIADVGHYESEQFTKELLISYISKKFPTFALLKSAINTNPVNYL